MTAENKPQIQKKVERQVKKVEQQVKKVERSVRIWLNTAAAMIALMAIAIAIVLWSNSEQFQNMVRRRLATQIQAVTGGRVEIGSFHWRLLHLEAEVGGLVIHGDEPANEEPYARVENLHIGLSILEFLSPRILLRELEVRRPQIHLIVYPDGDTNQPHPAHATKSDHSGLDTLFSLQAGHISVSQGVLHLESKAAGTLDFQNRYQPLDFRADDASLVMQYVAAAGNSPELYHIEAGVRDLDLSHGGTMRKSEPRVHGYLQASADLMRDAVLLKSLRLTAAVRGEKDRSLDISGTFSHFAQPHWQAKVNGDLDLRLLEPVLGYPFAPEGIVHLDLASAGKDGTFRIDGTVHAQQASYIGPGVVARGIDLTSKVHADPNSLRITNAVARVATGGEVAGEVLLDHWLPPTVAPVMEAAPPPAARSGPGRKKSGTAEKPEKPTTDMARAANPPAHHTHEKLLKKLNINIPVNGKVNTEFRNMSLESVLAIVGQPPFQHLGINTVINGPANAVWVNGDVNTLTVKSSLNLSPGASSAGGAPANGTIDGTYTQRNGAVDLRDFNVNLPASHLNARGALGAFPLTSATNLNVDFQSGNLGEFDTVLRDLGLSRNGKSGSAALPVSLGGQAEFHGSWAGSLMSPRLTGELKASQVALELPPSMGNAGTPRTLNWDTIEADGTYDAEHIAIIHAQLRHGPAEIAMDGTLTAAPPQANPSAGKAKRVVPHPLRGDEMPAFSANSLVNAHIRANRVGLNELLPLANLDIPLSGSLDTQITVEGPVHALGGSGWAQLNDAVAYGEPLSSVRIQGSLANQVVKLASFTINEKAGTVAGSGNYDLQTRQFQLDAHGSGVDMARIERLRATNQGLAGKVDFNLSASGTREAPRVEGRATVAGLAVRNQLIGGLTLNAHTTDHLLHYDADSDFRSAEITVHGQTDLRGDYPTQARLEFSRFDVGSLFKMAGIDSITAESALSGTANVEGPLAKPQQLRGEVRLPAFAAVVAGVHLKSDAPVQATLNNNRVTLDPVHITGDDTDLRAQGALALSETQRLDLAASGSVNLKLAETIDRDLTASGTTTFQIEAHGPLANPNLRGRVDFQNGALSLEDLPNGLSQIHGALEFNQNRLEVRSLTAMTGGGQVSLGGYLAYQHGVFADVTATGKGVRIRYPQGVSSLADANLHLQGTQSSLLLSGNVMITRFSVSPDLDIASLANQANAVQPIAPPNAPSNHVRLDVRIQSSPQLNFQNAYAKLAGDVDLRLRGTVASPSLLGRISITEGNATIAGTRYELQRGDVTFSNPVRIQPNIDLNATARVEDYDITLGLHGTPDKMSVSYRSDPPLPEADVVALLALGRTQSEQGLYTQQQQQSIGGNQSSDVLLGGALNATVSSRVQKLFGAGSVKVDPSYLGALGNSTTRITVEEQVGKNVTLTYATNVDTSAQQLLQAEIAINRHVSVQLLRDESGVFSMVIKAIRRYR